jgi:uncharacterized DUF497 family protein
MVDFKKIIGFEWDEGNSQKNQEKHGVTQGESEEVFFNEPLLIAEDPKHSSHEMRFVALGKSNFGILLTAIFTLRKKQTLIRVISIRPMSKRERKYYEQAD